MLSEKNLLTQESSGRIVELEEIQEDTSPSKNTSLPQVEPENLTPPPEVTPFHRSERTIRAPKRLCLNLEVKKYSLGDLNKTTSYKAAMSDPETDKWQAAMNVEMTSMDDNEV